MNDFDKQFNRTKNIAISIAIGWACIVLALLGGLIYIALHFIWKFW